MSASVSESNSLTEIELNQILQLNSELKALAAEIVESGADNHAHVEKLHPMQRESALNLLHYLALRRRDIRPLQTRLAQVGLSSLGRAEAHVLANVIAVCKILQCASGQHAVMPPMRYLSFEEGRDRLHANTQRLLGGHPADRSVRIMVTMPGNAAKNPELIPQMLKSGMDCMRINCAHDDTDTWMSMITTLRAAEKNLGQRCRVLMDLGGPKLRTGPIGGPPVVKSRPRRDDMGRVIRPARLCLIPEGTTPPPSEFDLAVPVAAEWLKQSAVGDMVFLIDARGARRNLDIKEIVGDVRIAESSKTLYLTSATIFQLRNQRGDTNGEPPKCSLNRLEGFGQSILLHKGETLVLTLDMAPGKPADRDENGTVVTPARIGCSLPHVFSDVKPDESVWLDDGKIGGVIRSVTPEEITIEITQAKPEGERLMADKGINLPESDLRIPALSEKDRCDLEFVAQHADMVGLSFVNTAADVEELREQLAGLNAVNLGVVLKIETRRAFQQLPELLLAAMRFPSAGVMIARGDLAVECGFERLAEIQEEILWISEAAHMPVIWATQVLETLAKKGIPTRAEITDAAMGERAECVMLNKGPHILSAIGVLENILRRMQSHQSKKAPMLRQLKSWSRPIDG